MKKIFLMATAIFTVLLWSCNNSDDNDNQDQNNGYNTSINPPDWIKGVWVQKDLSQLTFTDSDIIFHYPNSGNRTSDKALIEKWLETKNHQAEVLEQTNFTTYKMSLWIHPDSKDSYLYIERFFKKIDENTIEYYTDLSKPAVTYTRSGGNTGGNTGGNNSDNRFVGTWQNSYGDRWTGTSSSLRFLSVSSSTGVGGWYYATQMGYMKLGDAYLKDFEKQSANKYRCTALWYRRSNGIVQRVDYSSNMTAEFSNNGNTLSISGYDPWEGNYGSTVLTKQ